MKLVIIESPYAGDIPTNTAYAREALRHSILLGESPIASHLLYTQPGVLNDAIPAERNLGIALGHAWRHMACFFAFYCDLGISPGMASALDLCKREGIDFYLRHIR